MKKLLFALCAVALSLGCTKTAQPATAVRITSRDQLIGGQRALGEIGDYKISNGIVHAIVQNVGHSRGFGVFGGSLIDVDLVRGGKSSAATGVAGNDYFTEMFPAFFLQAIEPQEVSIVEDAGGAAVIRVTGRGANFLSLTKSINELVIGAGPLEYQVDYILEPGKQYVKIKTTMTNVGKTGKINFQEFPFGYITLLGEGQKLFVPGKAGYDMRFRLDDVYKQPSALNAIPGEVAPMMTTEGDGVSYGVAAGKLGAGYLGGKPEYYPTAKADSLLIPLASGSFLATMWGKAPSELAPGAKYTFVGYLAVGSGDVASVQKVIYGIDDDEGGRKPLATGTISGRVREQHSNTGLGGISVVLKDAKGLLVGSAKTLPNGQYSLQVPPGTYQALASDSTRSPGQSEGTATVEAGGSANLDLFLERPGYLSVSVHDPGGRPLPSKISVEAIYDHAGAEPPREFLYDLKVGERVRPSDMDPDLSDDPDSRRYLERYFFAPNGTAGRAIKAGKYRVFASRGIEYDLASAEVELAAGEEKQLQLTLRQVVKTPGYVAADLHVHSVASVDSAMQLPERVASYAAEGIDYLTSTDHNYISDYAPAVEGLGLSDWLSTSVGLELTTLEMGHFNAFPLKVDPGSVTHGAVNPEGLTPGPVPQNWFDWFHRKPADLFANLRSLGKDPQNTLIQVNHPRDSIMGYFTQFNMGAYTGTPLPFSGAFHLDITPEADGTPSPYAPENFSLDFDILEVFNGKHLDQVHNYRVPAVVPPGKDPKPADFCAASGAVVDCIPAVGEVIEESVPAPDGGTLAVTQPLYPGSLDDYYTLAAKGHELTAVGNSDSHGASAEAGLPRTYIYAGDTADGSMRGLSEDAVMKGLKARNAYVTNGPILELTVNDMPPGSKVVSPDLQAKLKLVVKAAPWVDVSEVVIKRGYKEMPKEPEVLEVVKVPASTELERIVIERSYTVTDGSFLVVEVSGLKSMWPVYTPYEIASIQINEAVGTIGASFGYGNKYGRYMPEQLRQVTPFAFTNPVWIIKAPKQALTVSRKVLQVGQKQQSLPARMPDLRQILGNLHGDTE
ncbi:MAG: carboxypeptidase regulatory-like domain-containing protein [Myxococcaceae bacterium]